MNEIGLQWNTLHGSKKPNVVTFRKLVQCSECKIISLTKAFISFSATLNYIVIYCIEKRQNAVTESFLDGVIFFTNWHFASEQHSENNVHCCEFFLYFSPLRFVQKTDFCRRQQKLWKANQWYFQPLNNIGRQDSFLAWVFRKIMQKLYSAKKQAENLQ